MRLGSLVAAPLRGPGLYQIVAQAQDGRRGHISEQSTEHVCAGRAITMKESGFFILNLQSELENGL